MRLKISAAVALALSVLAVTAAVALAGTSNYCVSCTEPNNSNFYNSSSNWNTLSYNHYLGTGTRYIGAGEINVGSTAWANNEVSHSYSGAYYSTAYAANQSGHSITANAHSNY